MIRIAIAGYGNLGKGVEFSILSNPDMELVGIFTRRDPKSLTPFTKGVPVWSMDEADQHTDEVDILILCGGSATDLPTMTPDLAKLYNVIDSFDTHAMIPTHFANVDAAAKETGHAAMISVGWDPGMFSVARLYAESILTDGKDYTFWGRGVSQGHSDAIRRIAGVLDARQYTVPIESAMERVRSGEMPELSVREKHLRECYVVADENADKAQIEKEIKEMPNYFSDYDTTVHFISMDELKEKHMGIPHGGSVIRSGKTGAAQENAHTIEFKLTLDSNPEFTACVLCAYARALFRRFSNGATGAYTVFDIAPAELSMKSAEELRAHLL